MDALSSIFSAARLTGRIDTLTTFAVPWGVLFESHAQSDALLHLIVDGSCCLRAGGHLPVRLQAGDLVILPSGGAHILSDHPESRALPLSRAQERNAALLQTHGGATTTVLSLAYSQDMVGQSRVLAALPEPLILRQATIEQNPQLHLMVQLMRTEAATPGGAGASLVLPRLLDSLLALALRHWIDTDRQDLKPSWLRGLSDPGIARMLDDVHTAPGDDWTLRTMALSAGLSRATFARRFADLVGETPMAYLNHWRMVLAAQAISDGTLNVEEAAHQHGYSSAAAFSRAFRRSFGAAPSTLRKPDGPDLTGAAKIVSPEAVRHNPAVDVVQDEEAILTPQAFRAATSGAA